MQESFCFSSQRWSFSREMRIETHKIQERWGRWGKEEIPGQKTRELRVVWLGIHMIMEPMKGEGVLKRPWILWHEEKLNIRIFTTNLPDIHLKLVLEDGKWEDKGNWKQSFISSPHLPSILSAWNQDLGTAVLCLSPPPSGNTSTLPFTKRPVMAAGSWEVRWVAIYHLIPKSLLASD